MAWMHLDLCWKQRAGYDTNGLIRTIFVIELFSELLWCNVAFISFNHGSTWQDCMFMRGIYFQFMTNSSNVNENTWILCSIYFLNAFYNLQTCTLIFAVFYSTLKFVAGALMPNACIRIYTCTCTDYTWLTTSVDRLLRYSLVPSFCAQLIKVSFMDT